MRRTLRRVLLTALVLGCLLAVAGGWLGLRGWQARGHLENAASLARELSQQVLDGQTGQARRTLEALQQQTGAARSRTGDIGWRAAGSAPYAGRSMVAVRELAAGVDELARRAFPALVELNPQSLLPTSGRLDLAALRGATPSLVEADTVVREVRDRIVGLPTSGLAPAVRDAVARFRAELDRLVEVTTAVRRSAALLPTLLGDNGTRTYLAVFQNLAEPRATGGIFGAYAVIRASKGEVKLVKQGSATELNTYGRPPVPLSKELRALYTDLPGIYPADVNLTPHFPTAATLYREMYRRAGGGTVDGVLATDPVALSYLLNAIGPVQVPGHPTLTAPTVVRTLLSDAYRRLDKPAQQDNYFAVSARAVFDAVLTRPVNPRAVAQAVNTAVTERRILFWSAHPAEQQELVDTRLAGVLPEQESVHNVGVFLNDGSGAKLGYYLHRSAELTVGDCRADRSRELHLRITLRSSAPRSGLSETVRGLGLSGDPYTARVLVSVFSPVRGAPLAARLDGKPKPMGGGVERGRRVGVLAVDVGPGRTRVLEVGLLTPPNAGGTVELWLTPGPTPWTTRVSSAPACGR
ncbi:DUF4012 domain-containing protein [Plantactinospora endophytica]|uniref:DUF4012 domain-containing protein n=1 Tax=Plantactinospora endophytica TaxID=673535 RepID=A0ABQ4DXZ6_9ACTN|nr:DUF4012 domain-containing protein [Plantactinospora endophytica]GIG87306.1 hypothetical protein Pen02_22420 [Plantactinospora endophytica]